MKRYKYNLSHYHLFTCDMGQLVPATWMEVLPGDSFDVSPSLLVRCEPLVRPVMHPVQVRLHSFFVPNRIIDANWEAFITGDDEAVISRGSMSADNELVDHLGIPARGDLSDGYPDVLNYPVRAYQAIYRDWFRDQQIQAENSLNDQLLQNCGWEKSFISGARLSGEQGPEEILPSGAIAVRELRAAMARQQVKEARNRYGQRYTEYLRYLGIKPSDARLDRPEYLGGGRATIAFSEVLQTVNETEGQGDPLGQLGGHGIAAVRGGRFRKFFEEHGIFMTVFSVRPKEIWVEGIKEYWRRENREDWWFKEHEYDYMQIIKKREVQSNSQGADIEDEQTFGYHDRYYQYRSERSFVSGEFRDDKLEWHLGRISQGIPQLNDEFVTCVPSKRIYADQVAHGLNVMANFNVRARRLVKPRAKPGGFK